MENIKIYLDTSVISTLFDTRTPERQRLTKKAWINLKTMKFIYRKRFEVDCFSECHKGLSGS